MYVSWFSPNAAAGAREVAVRMLFVKRVPKSGMPSVRGYDIVMTFPSWISAAAALVTAGVTRLVAPVSSLGPQGEGGTILLQSLWASATDAPANTKRTAASSHLNLMRPAPFDGERHWERPPTRAADRMTPAPDIQGGRWPDGAAPYLTAGSAGDYVGLTIQKEAHDAEHERLPRPHAPARGEDHRQDHTPRAHRRQGDGRLVVHEGGRPRRRSRAHARADLLGRVGHHGLSPGPREADVRAGCGRRHPRRRRARGVVPRGHRGRGHLRAAARGLSHVRAAVVHDARVGRGSHHTTPRDRPPGASASGAKMARRWPTSSRQRNAPPSRRTSRISMAPFSRSSTCRRS